MRNLDLFFGTLVTGLRTTGPVSVRQQSACCQVQTSETSLWKRGESDIPSSSSSCVGWESSLTTRLGFRRLKRLAISERQSHSKGWVKECLVVEEMWLVLRNFAAAILGRKRQPRGHPGTQQPTPYPVMSNDI